MNKEQKYIAENAAFRCSPDAMGWGNLWHGDMFVASVEEWIEKCREFWHSEATESCGPCGTYWSIDNDTGFVWVYRTNDYGNAVSECFTTLKIAQQTSELAEALGGFKAKGKHVMAMRLYKNRRHRIG